MSIPLNVDPVRGIERSPLFRGIPERAVHALSMFCEPVTLRDKEVLAKAGAPTGTIWLLLSGQIAVEPPVDAGLGDEPVVLEPGVLVGHVDMLNQAPLAATFTARGGAVLLAFGAASVKRLLKEDALPGSAFRRALVISLSNQLLAANRRMAAYAEAHPDAARPSKGVLRDVALLVQGHSAEGQTGKR